MESRRVSARRRSRGQLFSIFAISPNVQTDGERVLGLIRRPFLPMKTPRQIRGRRVRKVANCFVYVDPERLSVTSERFRAATRAS